jgi:uncharacterized SAM-binding protein YcdF (DUF218 family)
MLGPASPLRWLRLGARLVALVVVLLGAYVGVTFVQVWRASTDDGARPAQAIVVLGAAQYDGRPSLVLRDRLDHAHELWQEGLAPLIVVTGGRQEGDRFTEAASGYSYLRDRGVPDDALLREESGKNTWEQLAASSRFLRERGINDVLLVSDGYHAKRLQVIADELGLDASVSPSASRLSSTSRIRALVRETGAVSISRVIGYRRLVNLDAIARPD